MEFGDAYLRSGMRRAGVPYSVKLAGVPIFFDAAENTTDEDLIDEPAARYAGRVHVIEAMTKDISSALIAGAVVTRASDAQKFTVIQTRRYGDGEVIRIWLRKD